MHKPLVWMKGMVSTPPFSPAARLETGYLLRLLQSGKTLSLPHSRPMPSIGNRCHELRVNDDNRTFRIIYRLDIDAVIIVDVFEKKTQTTPIGILRTCTQRLKHYDAK
jgi:phage-related protein